MKRLVLILLAAVVAVSGCTGVADATVNDLDEQTEAINQNTEKVVEENNKPVTKYEITGLATDAHCTAEGYRDAVVGISNADVELFELSNQGLQSYQNSKLLIVNGIEEVDPDVDCQNRTHEEESVTLQEVTFNKSVYQNGSLIASGENTCEIYESADLRDEPWNLFEFAEAMADQVYEDCFGVEYRGEDE